jgi:hypothetical protein
LACERKDNKYVYTARLQKDGTCGAGANALFYVDDINGSIVKESDDNDEDDDEFRITRGEKFLMVCEREDNRYGYYARLQKDGTCGSGDNALFYVDDINGSIVREDDDDEFARSLKGGNMKVINRYINRL